MLQFTKEGSEYSAKTTINVTEAIIIARRFTYNKLYTIVVDHDGTIGEVGAKANRVVGLSNELFAEFARIQAESLSEAEEESLD